MNRLWIELPHGRGLQLWLMWHSTGILGASVRHDGRSLAFAIADVKDCQVERAEGYPECLWIGRAAFDLRPGQADRVEQFLAAPPQAVAA